MHEYKEYKLSELFQLLENNKIIEMKNEKGFTAFIKYDDKANLLIKYRDTTNWCWLQDSTNHLVKSKFRVMKTIKDQIKEVFKVANFDKDTNIELHDIDTYELILHSDHGKEGILFYENSYQLRVFMDRSDSEEFSHSYPIGFLDKLHEIFKNNNYSFREVE